MKLKLTILIPTVFVTVLSLMGIQFPMWLQWTVFIALSVLLGLSHGAIDHLVAFYIIRRDKARNKRFLFLGFYVLLAVGYGFAWYFFPLFSLLLLLLFSSYHFGQAELQEYFKVKYPLQKKGLYLLWGAAITLALIIQNYPDIIVISSDLGIFTVAQLNWLKANNNLFRQLLWLASATFIILLFISYFRQHIAKNTLLQIIGQFLLLLMLLSTTPFLLAFSIFFGLWHSLKVLNHEYGGLSSVFRDKSLSNFMLHLMPFSLLTYFALSVFIIVWHYFNLPGPAYLYILLFIGSLALPHSIIMDRMYQII